jgi:hypothetical protein
MSVAAVDTHDAQLLVTSNAVPTARELGAAMHFELAALHESGHVLTAHHNMQRHQHNNKKPNLCFAHKRPCAIYQQQLLAHSADAA